ncbi:hypothetical protein DD592_26045, partial [Enterobacter cloacae complex sp. 2DZ2F20B]
TTGPENDPHVSRKTVAVAVGVSVASVSGILKVNKFHLHHLTVVQELKPADYGQRLALFNFLMLIKNLFEVSNQLRFFLKS